MQLPTEFFISKKFIKSAIIWQGSLTLIYVLLIFFVLPYFFPSNRAYVLGMYYTIALLVGFGYWIKRLKTPSSSQPVFTINKTCLKIGYKEEGLRLLFDDIDSAEIKENFFGKKYLNIIYNKEITYKIERPFHEIMMFHFEWNRSRRSGSWGVRGLNVEPEELVHSLNFHLAKYRAENGYEETPAHDQPDYLDSTYHF